MKWCASIDCRTNADRSTGGEGKAALWRRCFIALSATTHRWATRSRDDLAEAPLQWSQFHRTMTCTRACGCMETCMRTSVNATVRAHACNQARQEVFVCTHTHMQPCAHTRRRTPAHLHMNTDDAHACANAHRRLHLCAHAAQGCVHSPVATFGSEWRQP